MGAYLSQPVTDKETVSGEGKTVEYGVSSMQGWRRTMEDGELLPSVHSAADKRGHQSRPAPSSASACSTQ